MKSFINFGNDEKKSFKKFVMRFNTENDLQKFLKKMKMKEEDIKVKRETFNGGDYHNVNWKGLPEFIVNKPHPQINVRFTTKEDCEKFFKKYMNEEFKSQKSIWYPKRFREYTTNQYWTSTLDDQQNKYNIFVISKGRWDKRLTSSWLNKYGIKHYLVIEDCEKEKYEKTTKDDEHVTLLSMSPEKDNLGKGSIPVRNFVDDYCRKNKEKKYWLMDDNMNGFYMFHKNCRREIRSPVFLRICEEFSDRYSNLYLSGLQYLSFLPEISRNRGLVLKNTRIYSCMLISIKLKDKLDGVLWRGRYNEDTDLSLRLLKKGYPTILHQQFLTNKQTTMSCKGGNTDSIYQGDGLQRKVDSLIEQHPDVVKQCFKFKKVHHQVDYKPFKDNKLKERKNKQIPKEYNNWGLKIN